MEILERVNGFVKVIVKTGKIFADLLLHEK